MKLWNMARSLVDAYCNDDPTVVIAVGMIAAFISGIAVLLTSALGH